MGYDYPGTHTPLGGGRGWLDAAAAASIRRIDAAIGHMLQITEAGRSFFQQEEHWLKYLRDGYPIALNPNTPSEHQKGKAIDSDEAQNFVGFMEQHGWFRTVYRWVNGKWTLVERWHFEYFIDRDQHRNDPTPSGSGTKDLEEDEDMSIAVRLNKQHLFHMGFGKIKHLNNDTPIKGNHNVGPATLTMRIVQPDDKWIEMNTAEFEAQLDDFHIPRSVVDTKTGYVLDVSKPEQNGIGGQKVSGGAWDWARAAYQNTLNPAKPLPRY